jgi:hypothetical protein
VIQARVSPPQSTSVAEPDKRFRVVHKHRPDTVVEFSFHDSVWKLVDLLRANQSDSKANLNFSLVEPWLRNDCKRFVVTRWRTEGCSQADVRRAFYCLRHLGLALKDRHPPGGARGLRRQHLRPLIDYLRETKLSGTYCADIQTTLNSFAEWIGNEHPEAVSEGFDFEAVLPRDLMSHPRAVWKQSEEKYVERTVMQQLLDACAEDEVAYERRRSDPNFRLKRSDTDTHHLWARAIYAQAVKLAACVGRRSIALTEFPANPRTREGEFGNGQWGVWIDFHDSKLRNDDDPVVCIGTFGEIALDAIEKLERLTKPIRKKHPESPANDYLVILPSPRGGRRMTNQNLNRYLLSLTSRYQILDERGSPRQLTTHNFRTTHLSNIILGGAPLHVAMQAGAHTSSDTTSRDYAVRGDKAQMKKLDDELRAGALSGVLVDTPPSVLDEQIGKRQAQFWAQRQRVLVPNRFGYCALPVTDGPCVTSEDCIAGDPESGGPCLYHVLSPDAIPAIEEGLEVAEFNVQHARELGLGAWEENQANVAGIYRQALEQCQGLVQRLETGKAFEARFASGLPVLRTIPVAPAHT